MEFDLTASGVKSFDDIMERYITLKTEENNYDYNDISFKTFGKNFPEEISNYINTQPNNQNNSNVNKNFSLEGFQNIINEKNKLIEDLKSVLENIKDKHKKEINDYILQVILF